MGRQLHRLKPLSLPRLPDGMHADGGGLYLQVDRATNRTSWVYRFQLGGRRRDLGLGRYPDVTLADARQKATDARQLVAAGVDPVDARKAASSAREAARATAMTFGQAALAFVAAQEAGWKNAKHRQQWGSTLETYAGPVLGKLDVALVDTPHVLEVLQPIWRTKHETASRLRGRIERVLDWAKVRGLRKGENPARWRGHLEHMLPKISKAAIVEHHAALPYADLPAFMKLLRKQEGAAALALQLTILCATRTGETLGARWEEIDLKSKVWTIPAERMKAGREHRVPLSDPAITLLKQQKKLQENEYVFAGLKANRPLSNMAMLVLLRRMKRDDVTPHGFRSSFRDWAAERSACPREVVEMSLAHVVGSAVERAYQRSDLFERRRALMNEWAAFCRRQS